MVSFISFRPSSFASLPNGVSKLKKLSSNGRLSLYILAFSSVVQLVYFIYVFCSSNTVTTLTSFPLTTVNIDFWSGLPILIEKSIKTCAIFRLLRHIDLGQKLCSSLLFDNTSIPPCHIQAYRHIEINTFT